MPPKRKAKSAGRSAGTSKKRHAAEPAATKSVVSETEIKQTTAVRLRSYRFQAWLQRSDRKAALADEFKTGELDNSRCWLHGHTNPMRLWSAMKAATDKFTPAEEADSKEIFDILIRTGGQPLINAADPNDCRRPIDASNPPQRRLLVKYGYLYGLDINPTATNSPLYYFVDCNAGLPFVGDVIRKMHPDALDWQHPTSNRTTFHLALSKSTELSRGVAELLVSYAAIGAVDPYQDCFAAQPIGVSDSASMSILGIARSLYDEFESVHRPARIADVVPDLLPPLVDIVRDYAMHA